MDQSTIILKNHLNSEDIRYLRMMKEICKMDPNSVKSRADTGQGSNTVYVMTNKTTVQLQEIAKWINRKLPFEDKDAYEFHSANFYEIQIPYALHSDTSPDKKYYYQGIIPLGIDPVDKDAYTLIFDQTAEENVEWIHPVFNKPDDYVPFNNIPVRDPNYFANWKQGYKLEEQDCKRWFGNTWRYWQTAYEGFTLHTEYKWSIGDIFLFDSRHVHCASGIKDKGIKSKEGLLFILKKKEV